MKTPVLKEGDIKIADSPEQAFWINVKEKAEKDIIGNKREIIINEAIKELASKKIEGEINGK